MAKKTSKSCDTCDNLLIGFCVVVLLLVGGLVGSGISGSGYDKGCRHAYNTLKGTSYRALSCDELLR
jgi:hypothetical protein